MKKLILLLIFATPFILNAQIINPFETFNPSTISRVPCTATPTPGNLVVNGGFEQYALLLPNGLPNGLSQIAKACGWISATGASPDYFHRLGAPIVSVPDNFGGTTEVNPLYGGDAYAGIAYTQSYREIIRTKLDEPLQESTEYTLQFDVSNANDFSQEAVLKFQAYLGPYISPPGGGGELPINPNAGGILLENDVFTTNSTGWDTITFTFTTGAVAGQEYLYLGAIFNAQVSGTDGYSYIDNISLKPTIYCGVCTDEASDFPLICNPYTLSSNNYGKAITTDCSGNIYSVGYWNGTTMLNKYNMYGNLVWSQNINIPYASEMLLKSLTIEVDDNESIYIKSHDILNKYDSNGILSWFIVFGNDMVFAIEDKPTIAFNKQTGDIYQPLNEAITLYNSNFGTYTVYHVNYGVESNILKIDTNGNVTTLGIFSSDDILNLHFNDGLKVWYRNSSGIAFREYVSDILVNENSTWLDNSLISSYNNLYPLYYNHVNDEVYIFTGNQSTSNNNNTRILCISHDGTLINANILLPEALHYSGMSYRENISFNQNNGALAMYADNYQNNGSSLISTISANHQLDTKTLVSTALNPNPFFSDSHHAISYGGTCLYFFGHYQSVNNVTLDGGIILPPSGIGNNFRSFIIRLQDDLSIESPITDKIAVENQVIVIQNPVKEGNVRIKFNEDYKGKIIYILYDINGNLMAQENGFLDQNQEFNLKINERIQGILFLKIIRDDGYVEMKKIITE